MKSKQLIDYYNQELEYIHKIGAEFAQEYAGRAGRLRPDLHRSGDPHTERLIEAFAFIAARIHKKIDDDFPEIIEALFSIVFPHYVNPVPSMSIAELIPIMQNVPVEGHLLKKHKTLYSKPIQSVKGDVQCRFRTIRDVRIWPVEITSAQMEDPDATVANARKALEIHLKTFNQFKISDLKWKKLRFYLNGSDQNTIHTLYELLFNNVCDIELKVSDQIGKKRTLPLKPSQITSVGFDDKDRCLPHSNSSFSGHLLLLEYFSLPEQFLFFDLNGLEELQKYELGNDLTIRISFDKIPDSNIDVDKHTFHLNTVPVVNLFKRVAEPIRIEHQQNDYLVIPDIRQQQATEIYSVDRVVASSPLSMEEDELKPFYSIRHDFNHSDEHSLKNIFWHIQRRDSNRKNDAGRDVYMTFTTPDFKTQVPDVDIVTVYATCTNRNFPAHLSFGDKKTGDFSLESAIVPKAINLIKPTLERHLQGGTLRWRLISHLSLNYLSLVHDHGAALKEMLALYSLNDSPDDTGLQLKGIVDISFEYVTRRIKQTFCRGIQVNIRFDEEKFIGTSLYLFACVLERFLGQYVSVNAFSQLHVTTIQREEVFKPWPPRNGNQALL